MFAQVNNDESDELLPSELDAVSDPSLNSMEKETGVNLLGDEKEIRVSSLRRTIIKSLMEHEHFTPDWYSILMDDKSVISVNPGEPIEGDAEPVGICGIGGRLPIGTLTIKSKPRKADSHSNIINV